MTGQQAAAKSRPLRGHAREALIEAASRRFYADGLAGTGIDAITSEAGVAKKSLYNNFSSKAELVTAYLNARHEEWMGLYRKRLESAADPKERVLAVFDAYADHAGLAYERGFRGCGLLNAAAELPAGDSGREVVRHHKEEVEGLLSAHLGDLLPGVPQQAASLARHLAYLLEGSMVRAGLEGNDSCVKDARNMASGLIGNL